MTESSIDARGLDCPEPVLRARKAIEAEETQVVKILVSSEVPAENIRRLADTKGWAFEASKREDGLELTLTRSGRSSESPQPANAPPPSNSRENVVVFITSEVLGTGEHELGRVLMRAFIKTLQELEPRPRALIFVNSGVHLASNRSDLLEDLRRLEEEGTDVLSCGTCLDYYHLADELGVGRVTNMFEIVSVLVDADRVLKP